MSTPAPDRKPASPLRGLAAGVLLALILFPVCRAMFATALEAIVGVVAGVFIAVFVHALASTRR